MWQIRIFRIFADTEKKRYENIYYVWQTDQTVGNIFNPRKHNDSMKITLWTYRHVNIETIFTLRLLLHVRRCRVVFVFGFSKYGAIRIVVRAHNHTADITKTNKKAVHRIVYIRLPAKPRKRINNKKPLRIHDPKKNPRKNRSIKTWQAQAPILLKKVSVKIGSWLDRLDRLIFDGKTPCVDSQIYGYQHSYSETNTYITNYTIGNCVSTVIDGLWP